MSNKTNDTLEEIARFTGKACAIITRDLADLSQSFTTAFRQGWREKMEDRPAAQPASNTATGSA